MFPFMTFLVYALAVGYAFQQIPWLRNSASNAAQAAAINAQAWMTNRYYDVRNFVRIVFYVSAGYVGLLAFAIWLRLDWLTFVVAMAGVVPAILVMYALFLLHYPVAVASRLIYGLGHWTWGKIPAGFTPPPAAPGFWKTISRWIQMPVYLIIDGIWALWAWPTKATAGALMGIGIAGGVTVKLMLVAAKTLATVTLMLLTLAGAALVGIQWGVHLLDPVIVSYIAIMVMGAGVIGVLAGPKAPTAAAGGHGAAAPAAAATGIPAMAYIMAVAFFGFMIAAIIGRLHSLGIEAETYLLAPFRWGLHLHAPFIAIIVIAVLALVARNHGAVGKFVGSAMLLTALLLAGSWLYHLSYPDMDHDLQTINADYNTAVVTNTAVDPNRQKALAITAGANKTTGFDRKGFNAEQAAFADGAAELYAGRLVALLRARRLPLPSVNFYVPGKLIGFQAFYYDYGGGHQGFLEAVKGDAFWIRAVGTICSDSHCWEKTEPDGIGIAGMAEHENKARLNEALPYRAFLLRFCSDKTEASCGKERYVGSEALVCAWSDLGRVEAGINEFVGVKRKTLGGQTLVTPDFTFPEDRTSGYSFSISTDGAAAACQRQGGKTLVAKQQLAATVISN